MVKVDENQQEKNETQNKEDKPGPLVIIQGDYANTLIKCNHAHKKQERPHPKLNWHSDSWTKIINQTSFIILEHITQQAMIALHGMADV